MSLYSSYCHYCIYIVLFFFFCRELVDPYVLVALMGCELLWVILFVILSDCIWLSKEFEWLESKLSKSKSEFESVWFIFDELDLFSLPVPVLPLDGCFVVAIGLWSRVIRHGCTLTWFATYLIGTCCPSWPKTLPGPCHQFLCALLK